MILFPFVSFFVRGGEAFLVKIPLLDSDDCKIALLNQDDCNVFSGKALCSQPHLLKHVCRNDLGIVPYRWRVCDLLLTCPSRDV